MKKKLTKELTIDIKNIITKYYKYGTTIRRRAYYLLYMRKYQNDFTLFQWGFAATSRSSHALLL